MMKVRLLEISDFEEVEPMLKEFFLFCGYDKFSKYDTEETMETAKKVVNLDDFAGFVTYDEDGINGIICGAVYKIFMAREKIGQELFMWSTKSGAGSMLLEALEGFAKEKGAVLMSMLKVKNSPDFVDKFYEKRGYELSETSFSKRF